MEPPPPPTGLELVPFATGFSTSTVTDIANAEDDRLFVVEKDGLVKVVMSNGSILTAPFLNIADRVKTGNWEEGLLAMAFHPDYANNGYFFVTYTAYPDYRIKLSRFSVSADPNQANPNSEVALASISKASEVHNGGDIAFGPDGYLYWPLGDGGPDPYPPGHPNAAPGDPDNRSQRIDELLGGILRLDVDKTTGIPPDCEVSNAYSIPPDNPYVGVQGCDEIWSIGLRNPWRMSFDRATGDLWIADVGEWIWEEIDLETAGTPGGTNYGWHCYEGTLDYSTIWPSVANDCSQSASYTFPIAEYGRPEGCSITGGFVYRGEDYPSLQGHYVFGDFCTGSIWRLSPTSSGWERVLMISNGGNVSTFGEDVDGELYAAMHGDSTIYKIAVP
jgi:glucose/arabinose dehydrogenase